MAATGTPTNVPSLRSMVLRAGIKNVDGIQDVGGLAYEIVRPILRKIQHPAQLRQIEQVCPQIAGAGDGELWRAYIKRDIKRHEDRMIEPKNPASWSKIYAKLKREDELDDQRATQALSASLAAQARERVKHQATISHDIVLPSNSRRRAPAFTGKNPPHHAAGPVLSASKGANFLASIRKTKQPQRVAMSMTTGYCPRSMAKTNPVGPGKVAAAPINMILEHKRKTEGATAIASRTSAAQSISIMRPPGTTAVVHGQKHEKDLSKSQDARMSAITNPPAPDGSTATGPGELSKNTIVRKRPATNCFMANKKTKR